MDINYNIGRELTRLAGFTARVTELVSVLKELDAGEYKRSMVSDPSHPSMPSVDEMAPDFGPNKVLIFYLIKI